MASHENPPALFWGTLKLSVFLVSLIPNEWYRRRARKGDKRAVQIGLLVLSLFGIANIIIRYFELRHLNCDWSLDAYRSATWSALISGKEVVLAERQLKQVAHRNTLRVVVVLFCERRRHAPSRVRFSGLSI